MTVTPQFLMMALNLHDDTLTQRLNELHDRLLETVPVVDRIACALYDENDDVLKTFINSTRAGRGRISRRLPSFKPHSRDRQLLGAMARPMNCRLKARTKVWWVADSRFPRGWPDRPADCLE